MSLVTVRDVSFAYEGSLVIQHLNFCVENKDYLCIVGENGSGKSTLMKGLLRLKSPASGEILLGEGLQANEIGYLPQQTPAQRDFPGSVYEVVLSGRLNAGEGLKLFYSHEDKQIAAGHLNQLGITALKKRCYRELSGGQQQRVLLARALCATEKMLLLDEPVSGLDPLVTQELYESIQRLNREIGVTIIMVSHDIQSAVKYADMILHLQDHQAFFGTKEEYLETPLAARFLGGEQA